MLDQAEMLITRFDIQMPSTSRGHLLSVFEKKKSKYGTAINEPCVTSKCTDNKISQNKYLLKKYRSFTEILNAD